jgi:hypothetical protein
MKISELKETIRAKVRKKLSEAVIDVTNPATETPATKKSKIDIARRTTGNKNLGTEKDPVEFIEETNKFTADRINKMGRTEVMEFLGVDIEELNYLVTKLKAFSFKNNKKVIVNINMYCYVILKKSI